MTGDTLTRVLRGWLHHDTYELFVAPAIADLQHAPGAAGYGAVWTSFAAGVAQDLLIDSRLLANDAGLILGLITMQVCYYGSLLLLLVAHVRTDQMLDRLANGGAPAVAYTFLGVVTASLITTLVCFWPPRRTLDA